MRALVPTLEIQSDLLLSSASVFPDYTDDNAFWCILLHGFCSVLSVFVYVVCYFCVFFPL